VKIYTSQPCLMCNGKPLHLEGKRECPRCHGNNVDPEPRLNLLVGTETANLADGKLRIRTRD
jgi:hypothetical protein